MVSVWVNNDMVLWHIYVSPSPVNWPIIAWGNGTFGTHNLPESISTIFNGYLGPKNKIFVHKSFWKWHQQIDIHFMQAIMCWLAKESLWPSDIIWGQWTGLSLIAIMACHLFCAKPTPDPKLIYCQLNLFLKNFCGVGSIFSFETMHLKMLSVNWCLF